ncbi:MAG: hypothetical protein KJ908_03450 [Acidobacteria bacterium]|nr:hypothetical protein [Acidobacteriota bacterium]MBU1473685.1 hypothetical protein [Acidobacteriota bacterium]MBU2438577.1 hypothetical protein [Acidobacteriota bacterium]MBU4253971.1 hypothetical protein [Acidobacteriota bacterium]MBU4330977.1 hypothetical protein [Acidobacteriota bacterium]
MRWIYHLIIAFLTIHLLVYMLGEKKLTAKIGAGLVLVLFLLRLFLIK